MSYCLEHGGWVGDDWDPHANDEMLDVGDNDFEFDSDEDEEEDIVVAPSQMIQQGGTGTLRGKKNC